MDHGLDHVLGVLGADHHVAQFARPGGRPGLVDGEGEDVGRFVEPAVLPIQAPDLVLTDERDGEVPVLDTGRGQRVQRRASQRFRGVDEVELYQPCCRRASRSAGARFSAYSL